MSYSKTNNILINSEVNKYLKNIIKNKLYSNGYIFHGVEGVGKKYTAIEFIKRIFEEHSSSRNIEEKIASNNHPDLLIIEPYLLVKTKLSKSSGSEQDQKNNIGVIKVDQIRSVKTFLSQKSIESTKKIVLIIDAHLMNEASSNCLLKTLEEPSNGIFILLTSKLDSLLDTIKSRCQLVRFRSFSTDEIERLLQDDLKNSKLNTNKTLNLQDLVNSSNGSPKKLINNLKIWNELSDEISTKLESPLKDSLEIFFISKLICEQLEIKQQITLINLIQQLWWRKTQNVKLIRNLESLKLHIMNHVQPRLAWEVTLFKIAAEINKI